MKRFTLDKKTIRALTWFMDAYLLRDQSSTIEEARKSIAAGRVLIWYLMQEGEDGREGRLGNQDFSEDMYDHIIRKFAPKIDQTWLLQKCGHDQQTELSQYIFEHIKKPDAMKEEGFL